MGSAAEWEAKKAQRDAREAEWAMRKAAFDRRQAFPLHKYDGKDCDVQSTLSSNSTVDTATPSIDEAELDHMVSIDKTVRKFTKTLREISKLELLQSPDGLQK